LGRKAIEGNSWGRQNEPESDRQIRIQRKDRLEKQRVGQERDARRGELIERL